MYGRRDRRNYMPERDLLAAIQLAYSHGPVRLFRINAGLAWKGTVITHTPTRLVLNDPRPIKLGPPGMSDLIGWNAQARFTAIEGKSHGKIPTRAQRAFLDLVADSGGCSGVAYETEDAAIILAR